MYVCARVAPAQASSATGPHRSFVLFADSRAMAPKRAAPCSWGSRLAVPFGNVLSKSGPWEASIDDVRAFVAEVHARMDVEMPGDEYFLNVLGTGVLAGNLPKYMKDLGFAGCRVVVFGAYKIRQPHTDAIAAVEKEAPQCSTLERLAGAAVELQKRQVRDATCVLSADVRGGSWYWSGAQSAVSRHEADVQEQLAWEHLGATPRDYGASITAAKESLAELEEKHGGPDPKIWKWGAGTPCADVSAADDAMRRHRDISEKIAAYERLLQFRAEKAELGFAIGRSRARSRSPRRENNMPKPQ